MKKYMIKDKHAEFWCKFYGCTSLTELQAFMEKERGRELVVVDTEKRKAKIEKAVGWLCYAYLPIYGLFCLVSWLARFVLAVSYFFMLDGYRSGRMLRVLFTTNPFSHAPAK